MRSSTFSFNRIELEFGIWPVVAGLIFGLFLLIIVEYLWQANGATSGYVDSKPRWSWVRSQVSEQQGVVLLGESRMHFGFSLAAFRDRYPDTPVHQLALAGSWPYAALRDLAHDEGFQGIVLISFTPDIVMSFRRKSQNPNVDHYRKRWNIDVWLNFLANSFAQGFMVTRRHNYGVDSIFRNLIKPGGLPPAVLFLETKFDREILADYSKEDILAHRMRRVDAAKFLYDDLHPVLPELWRAELDDFLNLARLIYDRGGCVVAIRFPSQGELYDYEQRLFPTPDYWSALETIPFLGTVHFESLDIMDSINLPDLSHVDKSDKYRFTDALLTEIGKAVKTIDKNRCAIGR